MILPVQVTGTNGKTYIIRWDQRLLRWTCTCPDWQHRHGEPWQQYLCKHLKAHLETKPPEQRP